jgi:hypothetical protein
MRVINLASSIRRLVPVASVLNAKTRRRKDARRVGQTVFMIGRFFLCVFSPLRLYVENLALRNWSGCAVTLLDESHVQVV